jgi:pimeloyl-ACP methyl ester carboxylesterase
MIETSAGYGTIGTYSSEAAMALERVGSRTRGLRCLISPAGLRGCGTEVAWLAARAVLYPLGIGTGRPPVDLGQHRIDHLSPGQRGLILHDLAAAATPILLVHGLGDNRSAFMLLRRSLRRRGFGRIRTVNYSVFTSDVRTAAGSLGRAVEDLCEQTGYERVHVVAHSLGGVIARYFVQRLGGDARVHTVVTLGAPHGGTRSAHLAPLRVCRQLRPGSELLVELAGPAPGCRTRFLAVWSDLDQLIYPKRHARIDHPDLDVRNVLVRGIGHTSLPADGRVARVVARALAHLDEDGSARRHPDAGDPHGRPDRVLRAPECVRNDIATAPFG